MNIYNQVREATKSDGHVAIEFSNRGATILVHSNNYENQMSVVLTPEELDTAYFNLISRTITRMKAQLDGLPFRLEIVK